MRIIRVEELKDYPDFKPAFREMSPEELKEAYALARAAFTAADLQRYTEIDPGIPFEEVLAELERQQKAMDEKAQ
jgi:hypothetical protein